MAFSRLCIAVVLFGVAISLAACTGSGADDTQLQIPPGALVVDVTLGDSYFRPDRLTVPAGEVVAVRLVNEGGFVHNMRIAGVDDEYDTADDLVSVPDVVKPGKSGLLVASLRPGVYNFRCDFHHTVQFGVLVAQ
ncbi:MAG: cupredoxin domain-containing protein [Chloroflexi bacterium]|nr:cupredoxin domain-containing protein [Chloroflexota bacterium]